MLQRRRHDCYKSIVWSGFHPTTFPHLGQTGHVSQTVDSSCGRKQRVGAQLILSLYYDGKYDFLSVGAGDECEEPVSPLATFIVADFSSEEWAAAWRAVVGGQPTDHCGPIASGQALHFLGVSSSPHPSPTSGGLNLLMFHNNL